MKNIIGREKEIERLDRAMKESEAQLILVYGRRRVGKTFLINRYFEDNFAFSFTGSLEQTNKEQLKNFTLELSSRAKKRYDIPKDWTEAFFLLRDYLEEELKSIHPGEESGKVVVFLDELPWLDKMHSSFFPAFEWFWNSWGASKDGLVLIVSGSASSWMTQKLDRNKGGLFNRHTCRLYLEPFDLRTTELYLKSRNINWARYDIARCYMIMGGVPFYLRLLTNELSFNENIDNLFFKKRAELWDEFEHLYHTLFSNSEQYIKLVEAMSRKKRGLTRTEIINASGLPGNGVLSTMLSDLENSGFIRINNTYGHNVREKTYQLSDYYSIFYLKFIKDNYGKDERLWSNTNDNPARRAWEGFTFEQLCKDHITQIKKKLGIAGVMSELSVWSGKDENGDGAEIDLIIDRRDRVINLCEIKFSSQPYTINKGYDMNLKKKVQVFQNATKTTKTLTLNMITTYGVKKNMYSNYIGKEILLEDLFERGE